MKAVVLLSGGLDSTLAARVIKEQGIEVIALNFKTAFCQCDKKTTQGTACASLAAAGALKIELEVMNINEDFFSMLKKPKYGYGSNMNPCIDCRILKFKKGKAFMEQIGARFIVTGEVLGQRPMSQHRRALEIIEKESGLEGLVLRPLSAKLLAETIPEKEGWVDRNRLLDFNGRSRKPQMKLAADFEIKDYPCPAGGCLLTDPEFSKRIKDLMLHAGLDLNGAELLKIGRHFRFSKDAKLVVGRNEQENGRILQLAKEGDYVFRPGNIAGPTALGRGLFEANLIEFSCRAVARYCDPQPHNDKFEIFYYKESENKEEKSLDVMPLAEPQLSALRI